MHLIRLLTTLTTLTLTSAIPLSPSSSSSSPDTSHSPKPKNIHSLPNPPHPSSGPPTPTIPKEDSASPTRASSLTHTLATLIAHDASASYDLTTCPLSHSSRQCCTSLTALAEEATSQLGNIVPYLSGIHVSSLVGLQCEVMNPDTPSSDCYESVMCCSDNAASGKGTPGGKKPDGAQSLFKSGCIPFDKAIGDKKKAIEKSKAEVSYLAEMSPTPSPRPSPSARVKKSS